MDLKMNKVLTLHQRLNVMLTVTAGKASKFTGIDTTQCMRTWHKNHTPFFITISNDTNAANRECALLQRNADNIILDCITIRVTEFEELFLSPHKKARERLRDDHVGASQIG